MVDIQGDKKQGEAVYRGKVFAYGTRQQSGSVIHKSPKIYWARWHSSLQFAYGKTIEEAVKEAAKLPYAKPA